MNKQSNEIECMQLEVEYQELGWVDFVRPITFYLGEGVSPEHFQSVYLTIQPYYSRGGGIVWRYHMWKQYDPSKPAQERKPILSMYRSSQASIPQHGVVQNQYVPVSEIVNEMMRTAVLRGYQTISSAVFNAWRWRGTRTWIPVDVKGKAWSEPHDPWMPQRRNPDNAWPAVTSMTNLERIEMDHAAEAPEPMRRVTTDELLAQSWHAPYVELMTVPPPTTIPVPAVKDVSLDTPQPMRRSSAPTDMETSWPWW